MKVKTLEARKTQLTTGTLSETESRVHQIAFSHPFTQQLEVILPSNQAFEDQLLTLCPEYFRCQRSLTDFVGFNESVGNLVALGMPSFNSDDVWCWDRKMLTIAIGAQTYQRLGLVGSKLPWKPCEDTHLVCISGGLHEYNGGGSRLKQKQKTRIGNWDKEREPWKIMFYPTDDFQLSDQNLEDAIEGVHVQPQVRRSSNVNIPNAAALPQLEQKDDVDVLEWEEGVSSLLEWVGLACLGSQRIRANDRPDPYLAMYEPPIPSRIGDLTHIQWNGLLPPTFIDQVLTAVSKEPFVAVVGHSVPTSPVTFQSPSYRRPAPRAPRSESEDTWTLVLSSPSDSSEGTWLLAETIGQWDARWG